MAFSSKGLTSRHDKAVYEALRKIAFEERLKIHDIVLEGIDAALRRRGYPSVENPGPARGGRAII
jgi:hypothetical protein